MPAISDQIDHYMRGAVGLNNIGVSLLQRGRYGEAANILRDAAVVVQTVIDTPGNDGDEEESASADGSATAAAASAAASREANLAAMLLGANRTMVAHEEEIQVHGKDGLGEAISTDIDTINFADCPLLYHDRSQSPRPPTSDTGCDQNQHQQHGVIYPIRIETYSEEHGGAIGLEDDVSLKSVICSIALHNFAVSRVCLARKLCCDSTESSTGSPAESSIRFHRMALKLLQYSRTLLQNHGMIAPSCGRSSKQGIFLMLALLSTTVRVIDALGADEQQDDDIPLWQRYREELYYMKTTLRQINSLEANLSSLAVARAA